MPIRLRTIDRLQLHPGDIVLDVACGTGLSFAPLRERIGPAGRLIGIEVSSEMIALARGRCQQQDWRNVTLIESAIEDASIDGPDHT